MSIPTLEDKYILEHTEQTEERGYIKFRYDHGDGVPLIESKGIARTSVGGSTLIGWCEAVRDHVYSHYQAIEREMLAQKRAKVAAKAAEEPTVVETTPSPKPSTPDIPIPYPYQYDDDAIDCKKLDPQDDIELWKEYERELCKWERVKFDLRSRGLKI